MEYTHYKFRAEVDWIELEIRVARKTQAWRLKEASGFSNVDPINPATGEVYPNGAKNTSTTSFRPRLQNPQNWLEIQKKLKLTHQGFDLVSLPKITAVEIALDAYRGCLSIA